MLNSGYNIKATRRIIVAGLKGYEKNLRNSKKEGGRKLLRTARESHKGRVQKKLLEKTNWFKAGKRNRETDSDDEDNEKLPEGWKKENNKKRRTSNHEEEQGKQKEATNIESKAVRMYSKRSPVKTKIHKKYKTRSVLFIIGTKKGILAKKLREVTRRLVGVAGYSGKGREEVETYHS